MQACLLCFAAAAACWAAVDQSSTLPPARHLYFIGVKFQSGADNVFHCELCTNLLMKR